MPKKKPSTKRSTVPCQFFCRHCYFKDKVNKIYNGYRYLDGSCEYVSKGLRSHIGSDKYYRTCGVYYAANKIRNFKTSLIQYQKQSYPARRKFKSSEIGVTRRHHCSTVRGSRSDIHRSLNNQVLFDSTRPLLDSSVIESLLPKQANDLSRPIPVDDNAVLDLSDDGVDDFVDRASSTNIVSRKHLAPKVHGSSYRWNKVPPLDFPKFNALPVSLVGEIELMNILQRNHLPLNTFDFVMDWAHRQNNRLNEINNTSCDIFKPARSRTTALKEILEYIPPIHYSFQPHAIEWLPDCKAVQVHVRSFQQALFSLLTNPSLVKEENFSFPLENSPFITEDFQIDPNVPITELHHGVWWTDSWKKICSEPDEILVPIILYMDGISLDVNSHLNLTPLNMTLGIFNTEVRRKAEAWETLYFHPDKITSVKKSDGIHNVKNLHNGIKAALQSFHDLCESNECITWDGLPYASKKWTVKMKFAIAYVIGDTQLHDQLCCRFAGYHEGIKKLCRHCKCDTVNIADPTDSAYINDLWFPTDFAIDDDTEKSAVKEDEKKFSAMSHHRMNNAFHDLQFGANLNNIHMATPGELLHMHQLGVAKRTVESIETIVKENSLFESIARQLGGALSRNSDRVFPRTQFNTNNSVLKSSMKEGKDYAGILLCLLLALLSTDGRRSLPHVESGVMDEQVQFIELVLGMEEFLKKGEIYRSHLNNVRRMMNYFVEQIVRNCRQETGMGNRLIKNHLYLHVHQYINLWGPPRGWDSGPSESHHKTEIKGPSKTTQRNAPTLVPQTLDRKTDIHIIRRVTSLYNTCFLEESANRKDVIEEPAPKLTGTHGRIFESGTDQTPAMKWVKSHNRQKPVLPLEVVEFCCKFLLPITTNEFLDVHTEHSRHGLTFRASPAYRSNSGQDRSVWYDWAIFDVDQKDIPCQILCFVQINELKPGVQYVDGYPMTPFTSYAVVRRFALPPTRIEASRFVKSGTLKKDLYVFDCNTILSEVAVVHNPNSNSRTDNEFFVVGNKIEWLRIFQNKIKSV